MDTGLFMFSPIPFVYSTYPTSPSSARSQLHANLVLPLAFLFFTLSLLAAYPRKSRIVREDPLDADPQMTAMMSMTPTSSSPLPSTTARKASIYRAANRTGIKLQRQNARLAASVRELQLALKRNAFAAFRDRLLLSNRIWAKEKEIRLLRSDDPVLASPIHAVNKYSSSPSIDEYTRSLETKVVALERARIADAAARDALDQQREVLIAELIQEIAADLEESQRQVERLRAKLHVSPDVNGKVETKAEVLLKSEKEEETETVIDIETSKPEDVETDLDQTLCDDIWTSKELQAYDDNSNIPPSPEPDRAAMHMDDLFSDPGSPTSTVGGDDEHDVDFDEETDYASDAIPDSPLAHKLRILDSPSPPPQSPSPPPSPSPSPLSSGPDRTFSRLRASTLMHLGVHPQSPGALALGSVERPYTTSARLLARCARARSAIVSGRRALRFPMWSQQASMLGPVQEAGESTASVNIFPGRSTKRARVDSNNSE